MCLCIWKGVYLLCEEYTFLFYDKSYALIGVDTFELRALRTLKTLKNDIQLLQDIRSST